MKKKPLPVGTVILITAVLLCSFSLSLVSFSDSSDPLVTLSYLTDIILPQFKKDVLMEVAKQYQTGSDTSEQLPDDGTGDNTYDDDANQSESEPLSSSYTLLELENGTCLYAESVLEIIVRPGSDVQVISPFDAQGIADITNSTEYLDGDTVTINSYCIIPRGGDGRGIEVLNDKSYILVRGEYSIG